MSLSQFARRRSRELSVGLVAGVTLALAIATPADAVKPDGSRATVMLETGGVSGDPANAITSGWWGHEGGANDGTGTGTTFLSLDASDGNGTVDDASTAALLAALGTDSLNNVYYAIVPTSADGSNEAPAITPGENAAEAFNWILYTKFGGALNGTTNSNDAVTTVSTLSQVSAWVTAGQPAQGYDDSLHLHDVTAPGSPESTAPKGTSILNTWPAGTHLSLVAYVSTSKDPDLANQVPLVDAGNDGKAKSAWMPFTTVANPTSAIRTSAGYEVVGAYAPTLALTSSVSGTTGSLTATVKNKVNAAATDATGTLEFSQVVNGVRGTPTSVGVTNGQGTLTIPGFTPGTSRTYDVRYVPNAAAQGTYLTTDYSRKTLTNPQLATSVALSAKGGATDTFTATVTPGVAGHVSFKDGATTFATLSVSPSVRTVHASRKLSAGRHTISAIFTPTSHSYKSSSSVKAYWQPTIGTTLKPARPVHGTRPKLVVKVTAPGTAVAGTVTLVFDPPKGATKRITVTLRGGAATVLLPKVVKGLTRVTVMYSGRGAVLAANKAISFRAT